MKQGDKSHEIKKYEEAYFFYSRAYSSPDLNRAQKIRALGSLASSAISTGKSHIAEQHLRELLSIDPENLWALNTLDQISNNIPESPNMDIQLKKVDLPWWFIAIIVVFLFLVYSKYIINLYTKTSRSLRGIAKRVNRFFIAIKKLFKETYKIFLIGFSMRKKDCEIFISYSRADKEVLSRLKKHLKYYEDKGHISTWDDTKISSGMLWKKEIKDALSSAKIAILLVSTDFLSSEFIMTHELPPLLEAASKSGVEILPIFVAPCAYSDSELAPFQSFNSLNDPLIGMSRVKKEELYSNVAKKVNAILKDLNQEPVN